MSEESVRVSGAVSLGKIGFVDPLCEDAAVHRSTSPEE
ncbi:hypothetical protein FTUN_8764 [Frigoriglobus tundricola]|uniref:Uncharacterized protein n=1 Tax=Frigoriglobus tundricola TaxID=2774151 RepID=A0A6M5Z604_9BACT|nr:hypothetical protein FTUN_8764 [Frigoriglobus tundricola]